MSRLEFSNVNFVSKKFIGKIQTTENIRISVKREIAQVLSVGNESYIVNYEPTNGQVVFYGKTNIRFVYDDGNGMVSSNYNADFTADIISDLITPTTQMVFDVITVDSKVDTTANTAMINITLEITAYAYVSQTLPVLTQGNEIFTQKQDIQVLQNAEVFDFPFIVDEELSPSQPIDTVLLAESTICLSNYEISQEYLQLQGNATVRLTYTSGGSVVTDVLPFAFDTQVDTSNKKLGQIKLLATARNTRVRLNLADDDANTTLTVEINCNLQTESFEQTALQVVTDGYGEDCDFSWQKQNAVTTLSCGQTVCQKSFVSQLPLDEQKDLLTAVNTTAIATKCSSSNGFVTVDGIVYATILYGEKFDSEVVEIPFSQKVEMVGVEPQCQSVATVAVCDLIVSRSGQIDCALCITAQSSKDVCYNVITSAEEIPFDKLNLPAMEICLAHKGETLWELAKNLHMSTQDILAINSDISDPLTQDTRLVIFNKI